MGELHAQHAEFHDVQSEIFSASIGWPKASDFHGVMSLARALETALQAADKSKGGVKRLHLDYLDAYAGLTEKPSLTHAVLLLDHLRKARQELAAQGVSLNRWERDCKHHPGFAKFRSEILEGNELDKSNSDTITRIYQNLRRMNFLEDASQFWPRVAQTLEGPLRRHELLRIWAVCPPEKLPQLDAVLSEALAESAMDMRQILSALSRTGGLPENETSKTLRVCLERVRKMVEASQVSLEDIATILYRLHVASSQKLRGLKPTMEKIKEKLVSRLEREKQAASSQRAPEGEQRAGLQVGSICRLLPCLGEKDEVLWSLLRDQLLKDRKIPLTNCLDILEFLPKAPRKEGQSGDSQLRSWISKRLELILSKGQALPQDLAIITRRLEVVAPLKKVCQALMNMAINLRQDLYPAVLWRFFVRTGEAGLAEQNQLMSKFHRISEILEGHGIQREKMSMKEMLKSAEAMRRNKVKMPKCLEQMAQIFLETLQHAQRHVSSEAAGDPLASDLAEEGTEEAHVDGVKDVQEGEDSKLAQESDVTEEAQVEGVQAALDAQDSQLAEEEVASLSTGARQVLLSEVQYLVLLLWAEFERMDIQHSELAAAALAICEPESCRLDTRRVVDCIVGMADVPSASSVLSKLRELLHLDQVPDSDLLHYLVRLSADMDAFAMAFEDVNRRLMEEKLQVATNSDRLALLRCLVELQKKTEAKSELISKVAKLLLEHMPTEKGHTQQTLQILGAACQALSEVKTKEAPASMLAPQLRSGLRRLKETPSVALAEEELVQFLFSLSTLHGGRLPFELLAYAWALAVQHSTAVSSDQGRAKLWSFCLCARHLSTESVWAALRLVPDAETLDASVFIGKDRKLPALALETGSQELLSALRVALSNAVPGEFGEARYQVPGTPLVLDFALERLRLGLLVVRPSHLCRGTSASGTAALNGTGQLVEALLEALGWRLLWAFPQQLEQMSSDELLVALRHAINSPSAKSIDSPVEAPADEASGDSGAMESLEGTGRKMHFGTRAVGVFFLEVHYTY
eukprot:s453_g16.t1